MPMPAVDQMIAPFGGPVSLVAPYGEPKGMQESWNAPPCPPLPDSYAPEPFTAGLPNRDLAVPHSDSYYIKLDVESTGKRIPSPTREWVGEVFKAGPLLKEIFADDTDFFSNDTFVQSTPSPTSTLSANIKCSGPNLPLGPLDSGKSTLAIRNIPLHCTKAFLMHTWRDEAFDFFYLPLAQEGRANFRLAFASFTSASACAEFFKRWDGVRLENGGGKKALRIAFAALQGRDANITHALKADRALLTDPNRYPVIIENGQLVPLPAYIADRPYLLQGVPNKEKLEEIVAKEAVNGGKALAP